jgi:HK97 family phage prohead protease
LALFDHDAGRLLGRTASKTLKLGEDSRGLHFDISLPDTTVGRDVLTLVERGDVNGASFAFTTRAGGEHWQGERRELRSVDLHDISIVTLPAYPGTSIQARARPMLYPRVALARRFLDSVS